MRPDRHLPLVPTLQRLTGARARNQAFTLIEILVSIALSAVLILISTITFRSIAHAIAAGNALSTQNSMLLIGWRDALEDADYYHSMADDKPPYNKGFMRVRTMRSGALAASGNANQAIIRRPFQPIMFNTKTDPDAAIQFDSTTPTPTDSPYYTTDTYVVNPTVLQAHDYRSIDRSHIRMNHTNNHESYRYVSPVWIQGDYRLVCATDMRTKPNEVSPTFPTGYASGGTATIPIDLDKKNTNAAGPQPNVTYIPTSDAEFTETIPNLPLHTAVNMTEPLLAWQMFNRFSFVGETEYTSMGYNMFIQDQNGNPPGDNEGWDAGELVGTSPRNFPGWGPDTEMAEVTVWGVSGLWWREDWYSDMDFANYFGLDFFQTVGMGTWAFGMRNVLTDSASPNGNGIDNQNPQIKLLDYWTSPYQGNGNFSNNQNWGLGNAVDTNQGDVARNERQFRTRTVRLPYNITDGEVATIDPSSWPNGGGTPAMIPKPLDYETKPTDYPTMETSQVRYYRAGGAGELLVTTTSIQLPNGTRIDLPCTPYTTTLRGARQHWRLYSPQYSDANAIGDFYDASAGPFYVPTVP